MKRWAIVTVALYATAVLLLTTPLFLTAFADWAKHPASVNDLRDLYSWVGYWIALAVFVGGQALLLLVPIDISERRLPARRKLRVPVIVAAFFLALLLCTAILTLAVDIVGENGLPNSGSTFAIVLIGGMAASWVLWTIVFGRFARSDNPNRRMQRVTRWLLAGSILEFLIAVSSHIIVRRREDCCAPMVTFWGIVTGISVMLMCFGPGVLYLFAERFRRLRPRSHAASKTSA